MSGQIPLDYPFEVSWLWETSKDMIWVSMLIVAEKERGKGHVSRLIDDLMKRYTIIIVPEPSNIIFAMLKRRGFAYSNKAIDDDFDGHYMIWKRTESPEKKEEVEQK